MFHEGEGLISPSQSRADRNNRPHVGGGRVPRLAQLQQTCARRSLTCTAEETLDRERPSRSDSRLEETSEGCGAFVVAGVTKGQEEENI